MLTRFCISQDLGIYFGTQHRGERLGSTWYLSRVDGHEQDFDGIRAAGGIVLPGLETPASKLPESIRSFFSQRATEVSLLNPVAYPNAANAALTMSTPAPDEHLINLLRAWRNAYNSVMDISSPA